MAQKNALGKGLGAMFPDLLNEKYGKKQAASSCGIEELRPNRYQPRKNFNDQDQKQLVASIKQSGIIQPIVVRKIDKGYEIIAGERRWRAAQAAGLKDVPIVIREATDMEEFSLSQEKISVRVGKDRSTIANTVRLLKLPAKAKNALVEKKITSGHARCLLAFHSTEEQIAALDLILKKGLNVRETERLIQNVKNQPQEKKPLSKDRYIADLEKSLSASLMAKVQIRGSAKKGLIEVRYTSMDELNRLTSLILDDLK
jgi:ParB family chromosome partitioning protein